MENRRLVFFGAIVVLGVAILAALFWPSKASPYELVARELEGRYAGLDVLDVYRLCADGSTPSACPDGMATAISMTYTTTGSPLTEDKVILFITDVLNTLWELRIDSDTNALMNKVFNDNPRLQVYVNCMREVFPVDSEDVLSNDPDLCTTVDGGGFPIGNHMRWEGIGNP